MRGIPCRFLLALPCFVLQQLIPARTALFCIAATHSSSHCLVLYCSNSFQLALPCFVLQQLIPARIALFCIAATHSSSHCLVLYCSNSFQLALPCFVLQQLIPARTALFCIAATHSSSHCLVLYCSNSFIHCLFASTAVGCKRKCLFTAVLYFWSYHVEPVQCLRSSTHVRLGLPLPRLPSSLPSIVPSRVS